MAEHRGERPDRLVVVEGGCLGEQLVGDAFSERVRGEDDLHELPYAKNACMGEAR
ncbi:hypothetical protein ACIPC1_12540 [Streptomyces sp. NPDC087263]|uniref:hypothetical protein n=1 Tax=Streptomyces sp. NPDC087263 TaxID=3365773 RepID=UPI0037F8B964